MFTPGCGLFLRISESLKERILHPAVAVEASREHVVARLNERVELSMVQPGASVFLHGEINRKFMQQAACVVALLQSEPEMVVAFGLSGDPIPAESRNVYRVLTAVSGNVWATLNNASQKSLVHDISATGLCVHATTPLRAGEVVRVSVSHGGRSYSGRARVQSVRERVDGEFRCGMHVVESREMKTKEDLVKGLGLIWAAVQREHARRLARA